jgi:SAM-dependent methyltransferase
MTKQFSAACERNRDPILAVLREEFAPPCASVLEIGSGTGQHAVYFAARLPHLVWHTSDLPQNHPSILAWMEEAALPNLRPPLMLDVLGSWPEQRFDGVFSANTCHIMPWEAVVAMFAHLPKVLAPGGKVCIYGPFNYGGRFTSDSNAAFDAALRARGAHMGIRDVEAVEALAMAHGLCFLQDRAMPANNRLLTWRCPG